MMIGMIGITGIAIKTHFFERMIDDFYDTRGHYLGCEELPTLSEVERVFAENKSVIEQIKQVNPGFINVEINSPCPRKGEILIEYPSHNDRIMIEKLIGDTFFGIPYRGLNY